MTFHKYRRLMQVEVMQKTPTEMFWITFYLHSDTVFDNDNYFPYVIVALYSLYCVSILYVRYM